MYELIQIDYHDFEGEQVQAVNARDLWISLEVGRDFSTWMKERTKEAQLVEGQDYIVFPKSGENPKGGRPAIGYALSLDAAKHVAMMEGNDRGKEVRQYFIKVEKEARKLHAVTQGNHPLMTGYYSVLAYANINDVKVTKEQAASLGKKASALSRAQDVPISKVRDDRWGRVNTYHQSILDDIFGSN